MIKRHLGPLIAESLQDFPVVVLTGARQVGKTTLAKEIAHGPWKASYHSFDDLGFLEAAKRDPDAFIDGLKTPVILDEVQRVPDILRSIKRVVDRNRTNGEFFLTGSANLLLMKGVSESLAGRSAIFELFPFSASEYLGCESPMSVLEALFQVAGSRQFVKFVPHMNFAEAQRRVPELVLKGGYPSPALMKSQASRTRWYESYRKTYLERDVRVISAILDIHDFGRLLTTAAYNTGQILNYAAVSRNLGIPMNTLRRHVGLLETTFQVWTLFPWFSNINKRLVKMPKWYFSDTGLAAHLTEVDSWSHLEKRGRLGALVETWVGNELKKACSLGKHPTQLHFFRTHAGSEIDFVLSRGDHLVPIEVKWGSKVSDRDILPLETFLQDFKKKSTLGIIFYSGTTPIALRDNILALPLSLFLNTQHRA